MADVILPALGESITEGIVIRWFKAVGEKVERDEPLFEISTDKVDSEVPSPASGVVTEILAEEGDTVRVGATVAVIGDGTSNLAPGGADSSAPSATPAAAASPTVLEAAPAPAPPAPAPDATMSSGGATASPMVRRLLEDAGVPPSSVTPSGPGGRITRADAERASSGGRSTPRSAATASRQLGPASVDLGEGAMVTRRGFVAVEADYESVGRAKRSEQAHTAEAEGIDLDEVIFAVRAAIEALGEFPILNASLVDGGVELNAHRNIGIALDFDEHLLVPIIPDAQDLNLRGLSRRLADVRVRARAGELGVEDLLGGTFTVTAPASDAVLLSIPQLIEPQVAVLSVGGLARRPVVLSDADGTDSITIRSMGILGLAYDSRVIDATSATRFLERVAELLAVQDWTAEL